ncbi:MAG: UvrD-helicase domain-containing protein [Deltaproteobacteria bacterium]|nr:UvrD-helicase domain-containing protein [Deltaproteobacteria bacterium]
MESLSLKEQQIILEEEANLSLLVAHNLRDTQDTRQNQLIGEVITLRDSITDSNSDDLPQIADQMSRLNSIIQQRSQLDSRQIDLLNPYFGRLILDENGLKRDFYIGTKIFRSEDGKIQIVDWKSSPISVLYFRYGEGDEYEEEIGGKWIEGMIECKRILKISDGKLYRLQQGELALLLNDAGKWGKAQTSHRHLQGGVKKAIRPDSNALSQKTTFGDHQKIRREKYLPEITALIDEKQFNLITQPHSGIVVIQGTAGSGKTTVALHRVAWLYEQDPKRFDPKKILVMVYNKALANYISKLLPSIGVENVRIDFFENWAAKIRLKLFGKYLPQQHCELTPVSVIRLKRHPSMRSVLDDYFNRLKDQFFMSIKEIINQRQLENFPLEQLERGPFIKGLYLFSDWIKGRRMIDSQPFKYGAEFENLFMKLIQNQIDIEQPLNKALIQLWDEFFSDFRYLKDHFGQLANSDFSENQLSEVIDWLKKQYLLRQDQPSVKKKSEEEALFEIATLDIEDDPILLYLYQKLIGPLPANKGATLSFSHLLIDEAQDLSLIELEVLLAVAEKPESITLCGDENQQMIQYNTQWDWDRTFELLGIANRKIEPLKVSYRASIQIMDFALGILETSLKEKQIKAEREGPPVELFEFRHQGEMIGYLSDSLKELAANEPDASVAVICSKPSEAKSYFEVLEQMEVPSIRLVIDQDFSFTAGVDITEIKQVKGLEFDYVVLLDADTQNYPLNSYSRFLLHIGATRSAHQLWILNYRPTSRVIPKDRLIISEA